MAILRGGTKIFGQDIFRNNNMIGATYPMAVPGVFSITGNSVNWGSTNDPNPFYYFFFIQLQSILKRQK